MDVDESDLPLTRVLIEFASILGTELSTPRILEHLVRRIVDILPITGVGVMLMGEGQALHFVAASNEAVQSIETLQNELLEGPCLEAYRTGETVSIPDLSVDQRFPRFSPRALEAGLAAVFTFPLRLEAAASVRWIFIATPLGSWTITTCGPHRFWPTLPPATW